ncbi:MAG: TonB-dependent receptor, partial [Pseudomonadales bacterium]|nr:TonB-dependent receptor [Pseudomonadales bacterium]
INDSYSLEFFASGAKDFIALNFDEDADEVLKDPDLLGGVDVRQAYNNQAFILRIDDDAYSANWRANALQQDIDLEVGQAIDLDGVVYNNAIMVDYRLAPQQDIDLLLGLELIEETFDYRARGRNQPCNEEFQVCPPSFLAPIIESKDKLRTQLPALFADMNWSLSDQLELNLGLRHSYISFSEQRLYEPRLGLTFFFSDQQRMWLRYGMHHQWFRGFEYGYIVDGFGTRELDVVEAEHFVAGFSQEQTSSWLGPYFWQFESYYKKLDKLVVANPDAQTDTVTAASAIAPYVNGASGEAYGFELLLRKDFSDAWQGWLTLAYSETNRDNDITGESFLFEFDQPWIINLAASYQLSRRVNVSAKWRYQSGNRYTDIIAATPIDDGNGGILAYDPIEGTLNGERFDASHRLDLRADVLISQGNPALGWRKPQIIAYFELLNAYGQKNQRGWDYEPDYSAREASYAFPEMPLPSIGFTFTF